MSASRIQELADEARRLLKRNPLMASTVSLQRVATRNLLKRRLQYGRTLAAASKLAGCSAGVEALSGYFPDLADGGYTRLPELPPAVAGPVGADPYRSSVLAAWMGALARSLEWQAARPDVQVVGRYLQPDLIASDVELERQPACRLACGIGLVHIESPARSRIMQALLRQCMPDYPRPGYAITDDAELDRIADHLEKAFALIADLDEYGHQRLIAGLHTLYVGVRREPHCSFSSSNELPGSARSSSFPGRDCAPAIMPRQRPNCFMRRGISCSGFIRPRGGHPCLASSNMFPHTRRTYRRSRASCIRPTPFPGNAPCAWHAYPPRRMLSAAPGRRHS